MRAYISKRAPRSQIVCMIDTAQSQIKMNESKAMKGASINDVVTHNFSDVLLVLRLVYKKMLRVFFWTIYWLGWEI